MVQVTEVSGKSYCASLVEHNYWQTSCGTVPTTSNNDGLVNNDKHCYQVTYVARCLAIELMVDSQVASQVLIPN